MSRGFLQYSALVEEQMYKEQRKIKMVLHA